jgi:hypothetical protein
MSRRYDHVPSSARTRCGPAAPTCTSPATTPSRARSTSTFPEAPGVPLVADMSSDILSRRIDASRFALLYAGAQKNLGPAGLTVFVIQKAFLETARTDIPTIFRFATHAEHDGLYHTPPTFAVYLMRNVLRWVKSLGGGRGRREAATRPRPAPSTPPSTRGPTSTLPRRGGLALTDERRVLPALHRPRRPLRGRSRPRGSSSGSRATAPSGASAPRSTTPSSRRRAGPPSCAPRRPALLRRSAQTLRPPIQRSAALEIPRVCLACPSSRGARSDLLRGRSPLDGSTMR